MGPVRRSAWILATLLLAGCGGPQRPAGGPPAAPAGAVPGPVPATAGAVSGPVPATGPSVTPSAAGHAAAHNGAGLPPGILRGNLGVVDQHGDGTTVRVSAEIDGSDGWVVVQSDDHGTRGDVLGLAHRANEAHDDIVVVALRRRVSSGRLWVTVHVDAGRPGVFDYPGPDQPLQSVGHDLTRVITLTTP